MIAPRSKGFLDELGLLARLALPIAGAQAGQAAMSLVDVAIVGRVGAGPLGAIGLANSLFFAVAVLGMGAMMGLDPLAAQALGQGDRLRARRLLWQGVWLALLASAVLAVPLALSPLLLAPMHVEPLTALQATRCIYIRIFSLPAFLVFISARSYLQAIGKTMPMLWATLAANVFNVGADLLFVFGGAALPAWTGPLRSLPALGAAGAALSTTLGTVLQLGVLVWAVRSVDREPLPRGARRPSRIDFRKAARVGLPIGLQMGAEVGVFSLVGLLAARFGDDALAAHQLALTLASFTFCAAVGVGNAGSVGVGWAVGQGDQQAVRRAGLVAFAAGAGFMSLSALAFLLMPGPLAHALTNQASVEAVVVPLLGVAAVFQISDGIQGVGAGVLRGAGDTRFPFVANVIGHYGIGLPIAITLGIALHHGLTGLWWGLCAGLTAVAISLFVRFWRLTSRPIAPLESVTSPGA